MLKRIVYTRHDGGVSVCTPTEWAIRWLGCGGFWGVRPRGWYDRQIESQIARGVRPDAARRYVRAMMFGGCTTAEAYEIIRDRDCAHLGTAIELWDAQDIPQDRWFRDAWRRSHNGGPISVSLKLAKPIQWQRIRSAVTEENKRRIDDFDCLEGALDLDWAKLKTKVTAARDEIDLRRVWPAELRPV